MSDEKILEEMCLGESQDTPQAITITIMEPSALETTTLDSSALVTTVQAQDDTGTLLVVPQQEEHASISIGPDTKNILQTVTETHIGTSDIPVISSISNTEEELCEENTREVESNTLESISESFRNVDEEGDESDDLAQKHCLICNKRLPLSEESEEEPIPLFKSQTTTTERKLSFFLAGLIGQKLTPRRVSFD